MDRPVELRLVGLGSVLVHGRGEAVAELCEPVRAGFDEIQIVAVALLGLVAVGGVVRALRGVAVGDQLRALLLEEVELPPDQVLEAHRSSR